MIRHCLHGEIDQFGPHHGSCRWTRMEGWHTHRRSKPLRIDTLHPSA